MMRLFLGIAIPGRERTKLAGLQRRLAGGRLVHVDDLHVTMVFLGTGTAGQVDELIDAIEGISLALPRIKLSEPGAFGRAQPRSAWLGVAPTAPLEVLHKKLVRRVLDVGFDVPKRKYVPHVTLARFSPSVGSGNDLAAFVESCSVTTFEPFQPHSLTLFQSLIGRAAPIYHELHGFPVTPV